MRRRAYLAAVTASFGALSGCSSGRDDPATTPAAPANGTASASPAASGPGDVDLPLDSDQLARGAPKDAIPAITEPSFGPDWSTASNNESLREEDRVIGVEREGETRAYPLRVLNFHEIVNDDFAGPLLVTFCPLCGSGVTAHRRVDGEPTVFGVSGLLWRSDLVMYDQRTESLWSQILARAVQGPKTGESLSLVPSQITQWSTWREHNPDTQVLLPPPDSGTITGRHPSSYGHNPYGGYEDSRRIGIGANDFDDDRLHPKTQVIGVSADGEATAYPLPAVEEAGVVNDSVGDRPIVVASTPGGTMYAYERTVDGSVLEFSREDDRHVSADGSRWNLPTGRAVDGPHEGTTLVQANDRSAMFWFAWLDFHPETTIYSR